MTHPQQQEPRTVCLDTLRRHLADALGEDTLLYRRFARSLTDLTVLYRPVEHHLRTLSVPAFVAWGDRDPFFPLDQGRRTADALGVPLHHYADAGHFLPHERPAQVAAAITALVGATVG